MLNPRIGARIGRPQGGGGSGSSWTVDGTSGKGVPASAEEWQSLLAAAGVSRTTPLGLWSFQEASGDVIDSISSFDMADAGAPSYQQTVTGWTRKGITLADGSSDAFAGNIGAANVTSHLILAYVKCATPAATRMVMQHANIYCETLAGGVFRADGGSAVDGVAAYGSDVHPVLILSNTTGNVQRLITDDEVLTPTNFDDTAAIFRFGGNSANSANCTFLYGAMWTDSDAEMSTAEVKLILQELGWTVAW